MSKKIKIIVTILAFVLLLFICDKVYAVEITQTLTNAPYNNAEYCESKLPIQSFTVTAPAGVSNAPTFFSFGTGSYNSTNHTYKKTCTLDFSGTTFSNYGEYLFELTPAGGTNNTKYYVNVFVDNTGYTVDSRIGVGGATNKETNLNITTANPNTFIKVDKIVKGDIADLSKDFTFNVRIYRRYIYSSKTKLNNRYLYSSKNWNRSNRS